MFLSAGRSNYDNRQRLAARIVPVSENPWQAEVELNSRASQGGKVRSASLESRFGASIWSPLDIPFAGAKLRQARASWRGVV